MKTAIFLFKLLAISIAISGSIRMVGPHFPLPNNNAVALSLVLLPPLLLGLAMLWRWRSLVIADSRLED